MAPRVFSVDTETWLIEKGNLTPPLVCLTWATRDEGGQLTSGMLGREHAAPFYKALLQQAVKGDVIIVGQNLVYDHGVLCALDDCLLDLIFEAYDVGAIRDTKERQKLIDLADGEMKFARTSDGEFIKQVYSLEALAKRHLQRQLEKGASCKNMTSKTYVTFGECGCGGWRLHYRDLWEVPASSWPVEAVRYPLLDAETTLEVYERQQLTASPVVETFKDGVVRVRNEDHQLRAHWALHLQSIWGIRTDANAVAKLRAEVERDQEMAFKAITRYERLKKIPAERRVYKIHTFTRGPRAGTTEVTKNQAAIQTRVLEGFRKQGLAPPLTEGGRLALDKGEASLDGGEGVSLSLKHIAIAAEAMRDSKDPVLKRLAKAQYGSKLLSTYIPALETGSKSAINVAYNLLLESGRTSCTGDFNPQVLPRKDGVRECVVPSPGYLICSVDYDQVELCTLGQAQYTLLGKSSIGDAINAGRDLHVQFAAYWLGIPYEEAIDRYKKAKKGLIDDPEITERRQIAKVPNFGKPGGMGDLSLIDFAKATYNIILTIEGAKELSSVYFAAHPDMREYFDWINAALGPLGEGPITQLWSGRIRGACTYCQACNTLFQGLAADGAKLALWRVARECYEGGMHITVNGIPLYLKPHELNKDVGAIEFAPGVWRSPLFGSRPFAFVHDEILNNVPIVIAHEAAFRQSAVQNQAMQEVVPDVKITSTPAVMERWYKGADAVFDEQTKKLIPWRPKAKKQVANIHQVIAEIRAAMRPQAQAAA